MIWKCLFEKELKKVSCFSWILKTVPIATGIITAKLMADIVSNAVGGKFNAVLTGGAVLLAIVIGMKIFDILTGIAYQKASSQVLHKCKMILYNQFLSNPLSVLYSSEHGNTIEKLNKDFDTITGKSTSLLPNFWSGVAIAAAYFAFIAMQSPIIALSMLAISLLQIIPPFIVKKYMQVNYDNCRDIEAKITDFTMEGYQGFDTIKLYKLKNWWMNKLKVIHRQYLKIANKAESTCTADDAMSNLVDNILKYGTYGLIGVFVLNQFSTLSIAIQAITLSGGMFAAVKTVFASLPDFAVAATAEKRIADLIPQTANQKQIQSTQISLSNVSFAYENKTILSHASVQIDAKNISVIEGANGIGKSTLFHLLAGLCQEKTGSVTIGEENSTELKDGTFPYSIFYLPQNDAVFDLTGKELCTIIIPDRETAFRDYAKRFGLLENLIHQSKISELSGGERKKVFLSLALTIDPPILLLDEPTNSLDDKSRTVLVECLKERGKGAVIISHDPIFQSIAQQVYKMEGEKILLEG